MKTYFVYILKCKDGSYYTGITSDLHKRVKEHEGGVHTDSYTFSRRPVSLVYFEQYSNPMAAIARETQIKGWTRKKKEALITENYNALHDLAQCNNLTNFKLFSDKKKET
jgi:putative endonuclease